MSLAERLRQGVEEFVEHGRLALDPRFRAISRPAKSRTLPPPDADEPPSDAELEEMQAAIRAHGCELLE